MANANAIDHDTALIDDTIDTCIDAGDDPTREQPFDPVASWETAVLGSTLLRNSHYAECAAVGLQPEHFTNTLFGELWQAIGELVRDGEVADPFNLGHRFTDHPQLRGKNVVRWIGELGIAAAGVRRVPDYARKLVEESLRRRIGALGSDLRYGVLDRANDLGRLIEEAREVLGECRPAAAHGPMMPLIEAVQAAQAATAQAVERGGVDGVGFGLRALDAVLGGAAKSDLVVLAGRPGMGKTALAWHVALHNARAGKRVAFFTLEMPAVQLATRAVAQVAGVGADAMRRGALSPGQLAAVANAHGALDLPLFVNRSSEADPYHVSQRSHALMQQGGLDLIVVDYVQLMEDEEGSENRTQGLARISRALKVLALELDVPVIVLSQLNRGVEGRDDKRPLLSDLRDSGAIEQDADAVVFVYREELYVARQEPRHGGEDDDAFAKWLQRRQRCAGLAELIVAKNRHGPCATAVVGFEEALTRFHDLGEGAAQ